MAYRVFLDMLGNDLVFLVSEDLDLETLRGLDEEEAPPELDPELEVEDPIVASGREDDDPALTAGM